MSRLASLCTPLQLASSACVLGAVACDDIRLSAALLTLAASFMLLNMAVVNALAALKRPAESVGTTNEEKTVAFFVVPTVRCTRCGHPSVAHYDFGCRAPSAGLDYGQCACTGWCEHTPSCTGPEP